MTLGIFEEPVIGAGGQEFAPVFRRALHSKNGAGRHIVQPDFREAVYKRRNAGIVREKGNGIRRIVKLADHLRENGYSCMVERRDECDLVFRPAIGLGE